MRRAAIFLNGDPPTKRVVNSHISQKDFIICADRGAEHAMKVGVTPHIILGDNDSLSKKVAQKLPKLVLTENFSSEKDETDSELAINYALKNGYKELVIFGLVGDRIDHVLSNIFVLAFLSTHIQCTFVTNSQVIYITQKDILLIGKPGEYLSLIPVQTDVTGITTHGLKYSLTNETLYFGKSRGVSNEFVKKTAKISLQKGALLVIHTNTKKE